MNVIKEYVTRTTKSCVERIYIQGQQLYQTAFKHIGAKYSYVIDNKNKKIIILPEQIAADGIGTISKKKMSDKEIPVLDISNKKVAALFTTCKQCRITILEDRIIVEGLLDQEEVLTTEVLESIGIHSFDTHFAIHKMQLKELAVAEPLCSYLLNKQDSPSLLKVLSLFSGIGAFEEGLKNAQIPFEVVRYCEVEKDIAYAYSLIHNEPLEKNLGDIQLVNEKTLPDFDLMTFGFPCQDITSLGARKGLFDKEGDLTRSGLFFEAMRIASCKNPGYMIAENVRELVSKNFIDDFKAMLELIKSFAYTCYYKVLNTKDYGIPHSRNRVFIICIRDDIKQTFEFPEKRPTLIPAVAYKESYNDDSLYLTEQHAKYYAPQRLKKKYSSLDAKTLICMTTKQGGHSNPQNFFTDKKGVRMLSAREMMFFQGFKKEYGDLLLLHGISLKRIGLMTGNTISVPVLTAIFKKLFCC